MLGTWGPGPVLRRGCTHANNLTIQGSLARLRSGVRGVRSPGRRGIVNGTASAWFGPRKYVPIYKGWFVALGVAVCPLACGFQVALRAYSRCRHARKFWQAAVRGRQPLTGGSYDSASTQFLTPSRSFAIISLSVNKTRLHAVRRAGPPASPIFIGFLEFGRSQWAGVLISVRTRARIPMRSETRLV